MNRVLQQWLLNLAIDFPIELWLLPPLLNGDDREPHALNVRALQGFTLEDGVSRLVELAENGLLEFTRETEQGEPRALAPSDVLPLMDLRGIEKELSFKLTPAGGSAWEAAAEPRWHDMDDGSATPHDENGRHVGWDWTLFSQDRERLMALLGWWPRLEDGEQVELDTVAWNLAEDYEVKYWKHLPNVHVVTFQSRSAVPPMPARRREVTPKWFTAWRIARSMWYRHPWEMEGWPPTPGIQE